jgi:hypothetical protein
MNFLFFAVACVILPPAKAAVQKNGQEVNGA